MHIRLLIVFALLVFLAFADSALAQGTPQNSLGRQASPQPVESAADRQQRLERINQDENVRSNIDATRAQREIERQERLQNRCDQVGASLEQYRTRFSQGAGQYLGAFERITEQLTTVQVRLEEAGTVDTTTLQAQLTRLREMIAAFESNKNMFVAEIGAIREAACSDPDASIRTQTQQSRTQLQALRTEANQIRSYIQNTIRPELQRLRQQLAVVSEEISE